MQRKLMTLAIFWFPIIGGILLGSFAVSAWYSSNRILGLWLGFFGVVSFLLVVTGHDEVYNAITPFDFILTQELVNAINAEQTRFFVYGFVKYSKNYERGFVNFYNPKILPEFGMFARADGDYPEYSRND